jgi:hypothetical protein
MASTKRMLLVTDASGRVLAAAHPNEGSPSKMNVGLAPLPGQEIHEVDVPEALLRLKAGHEFQMALSHAKFERATGKLRFPEVSYKKVKH